MLSGGASQQRAGALELGPSRGMPRRLSLRAWSGEDREVSVSLYPRGGAVRVYAYAVADRTDFRLQAPATGQAYWTLWAGRAAFDVTAREAAMIREWLSSLGARR